MYITGERIAVQYLLSQTGKGDLLTPQPDSEIGTTLPVPEAEELQEVDFTDVTVCDAADVNMTLQMGLCDVTDMRAHCEASSSSVPLQDQPSRISM